MRERSESSDFRPLDRDSSCATRRCGQAARSGAQRLTNALQKSWPGKQCRSLRTAGGERATGTFTRNPWYTSHLPFISHHRSPRPLYAMPHFPSPSFQRCLGSSSSSHSGLPCICHLASFRLWTRSPRCQRPPWDSLVPRCSKRLFPTDRWSAGPISKSLKYRNGANNRHRRLNIARARRGWRKKRSDAYREFGAWNACTE